MTVAAALTRINKCFCKHQEDILVITLWLANGGCGHFCRISNQTVLRDDAVITHADGF